MKWQAMAAGIEAFTASSAIDFIQALRPSNAMWWDGAYRPWVYRGHAVANWELYPTAWRPNNHLISAARSEASKRFQNINTPQTLRWHWPGYMSWEHTFGSNDRELARRLAIDATAELLITWDFGLVCNELGLEAPWLPPDPEIDPYYMHAPEEPLLADDFLRFDNVIQALGLAQHHGLPTRLLDWTIDPMAAAYFAVDGALEIERNEDLAIWALHRRNALKVHTTGVKFPGADNFPIVKPGVALIRPPNKNNPYLQAQSGLFTTITASGIYFMQTDGSRPSLEKFVSESDISEVVLRKLTLPKACIRDVAQLLDKERISRARLMPTMDNVARDVLRRWSSRLNR